MEDKLILIPNDDKPNKSYCTLKLLVDMVKHFKFEIKYQDFIKVPKVFELTNKMACLQNFGH